MITGLHHVSITVADMEWARAFYEGVLELRPCPQKTNWLATGDGWSLHLMPARTDQPTTRRDTSPCRSSGWRPWWRSCCSTACIHTS